MKIVHKDIAGFFSRQLMTEIIHQQSAAGGIRGAGIVLQEVKTCPSKSVLYAFPKNSKVIGIYTDANDMQRFCFGTLGQIPVHRRSLSVAHGRQQR